MSRNTSQSKEYLSFRRNVSLQKVLCSSSSNSSNNSR